MTVKSANTALTVRASAANCSNVIPRVKPRISSIVSMMSRIRSGQCLGDTHRFLKGALPHPGSETVNRAKIDRTAEQLFQVMAQFEELEQAERPFEFHQEVNVA